MQRVLLCQRERQKTGRTDSVDYLALFMEYLQVELGLSENTRLSYQRDLRIFCNALSLSEDKLAEVQR